MNKNVISKAKYCIQSEKHPLQTTLGLCSLMEHQSLVDIAVCCGSNILHAHKIVLAANSPLFREELEKNSSIEQVILTGCDFSVIRSLIEYMYCGETIVSEDQIKYVVAAARLFQMRCLENLSLDFQFAGDTIVLPKPQFLSKKPKYPAYPFSTNPSSNNALKPLDYNLSNLYKPHKAKRKFRLEAEHQACVKEAQASRLAIANLKKEIDSAPQASTFIIEESCTETTVENFIPHTNQQNFPNVDYNNLENQVFINPPRFNQVSGKSNVIQLALPNNTQGLTADKIKNILEGEANSNVEIMFKTSDGTFVTVTDEVLQNLQKEGLQYQVIDEDGHLGEMQEIQMLNKENAAKINKYPDADVPKDLSSPDCDNYNFLNTQVVVFSDASAISDTISAPTDLTLGAAKSTDSKDSIDGNLAKEIDLDTKPAVDCSQRVYTDSFEAAIKNFLDFDAARQQATNSNKTFVSDINLKNEIEISDDKIALNETLFFSPTKNQSSLKFSPDIFFADMTNNIEATKEEPDKKKVCTPHH